MDRSVAARTALCGVIAAAVLVLSVSSPPVPTSAAGSAVPTAGSFTPAPSHQAPCPEGRSRTATVYSQGFENGIPEEGFSTGFAPAEGGTSGSYAARSGLDGVAGSSEHMFLPYRQVAPDSATYLGFTTRTDSAAGQGTVAVNSVLSTFDAASRWRGVRVDLTAATRDEEGWLGAWFEHRARSGMSTSVLIDDAEIYQCRDNATTRVADVDRFATAAAVSQQVPAGVHTVYVAQGFSFPDALSASAVAGSTGAPILLVRSDRLPAVTAQALTRLRPQRIVVLGGTRAIETAVQEELRAYAPVVERIGGSNRYETSALLSRHFAPGISTAYVATGGGFADALSGGALAADRRSPLLLVEPGRIPDPVRRELTRLQPAKIVVLGGSAAVSDTVLQGLKPYATGGASAVSRIEGRDRYEVSAAIAARFTGPGTSYLSTGTDYADAITGGAVAGARGAPLLLTRPDDLPGPVRSRLLSLVESSGVVLGGPAAVAPIVRDQYGRTLP